jgi:hypothetical protein
MSMVSLQTTRFIIYDSITVSMDPYQNNDFLISFNFLSIAFYPFSEVTTNLAMQRKITNTKSAPRATQ